jgi:hypothetical protein
VETRRSASIKAFSSWGLRELLRSVVTSRWEWATGTAYHVCFTGVSSQLDAGCVAGLLRSLAEASMENAESR